MTSKLIQEVKDYCSSLHSCYYASYDNKAAMNMKADYIENDEGLIFIRAVKRGKYTFPTGRDYFHRKEVEFEIWFCRFSTTLSPTVDVNYTQYDKNVDLCVEETTRNIRDRIEQEVVYPFLEGINKALNVKIESVPFEYPTKSVFDSNEVAILLRLTIKQKATCLKSLR